MKTQNYPKKIRNGNVVKTTLHVMLIVLAFTFSNVIFANSTVKEKERSTIVADVAERLESPKFELEKDVSAEVIIVINKKNQMVVLSVDSENEEIANYIKHRLNYSEVSVELLEKGKTYTIPVKLRIG